MDVSAWLAKTNVSEPRCTINFKYPVHIIPASSLGERIYILMAYTNEHGWWYMSNKEGYPFLQCSYPRVCWWYGLQEMIDVFLEYYYDKDMPDKIDMIYHPHVINYHF